MKPIFICLVFTLFFSTGFGQAIRNTSFVNQAGEKVLQLEITLPVDTATAWKLFTTDKGWMKWAVPVAHMELSTGGYLVTNYDSSKSISDSGSIKLPIINFLDNRLLTFKVELNNQFPKSARDSDENLQEIIQFFPIDKIHTRIVSSMVGFGKTEDWNKTYRFFEQGNTWTYEQLLKLYK